jgi:acetyl esterase/lipase
MLHSWWCLIPASLLVCAIFFQELWVDRLDGADTETGSDSSSLLQTKVQALGTSNSSETPEYSKEAVLTGDITPARGHVDPGTVDPPLSEDEYVLSTSARSNGYTPHNAYLDGAGEEWSLFPSGKVPYELPGDAGPEKMVLNDPTDKCSGGDVSGYSIMNVSKPALLTFIVPKDQANRKKAAVIVAPGGGFKFLSWNKEGTEIAKWLNTIGISAFVLKYRVPSNSDTTWVKGLVDSQRAISMVRSKSKELDIENIGFIGFSAGGWVTSTVSKSIIKAYKHVDEIDELSVKLDFALMVYASGETSDIEIAPPTFLVGATDDPCISADSIKKYYSALVANNPNGYQHEMHMFPAGKHGYGDCKLYVSGNEWQPVCEWTINAQLFMENQIGIKRSLGVMTYSDEAASTKRKIR